MGKIIAIVNQKGGVGKTTTAVNLTAALTDLGKRVLLCDFDPQANATSGMGVDKRKIKYSSYDVTINGVSIESAILETKFGDVVPSSADLAGAGVELIGSDDREHQLKAALESVKDKYDAIFIDCPPSLELLTLNDQKPQGRLEHHRIFVEADHLGHSGHGQAFSLVELQLVGQMRFLHGLPSLP